MKRLLGVATIALVLTAAIAPAQQTPSQPGMGGQMPMSGGMCPMMGSMMGGGGMMPMMGMMGGQGDSPKMMQLRGEMLKAMGDVLIKHGKQMEGTATR